MRLAQIENVRRFSNKNTTLDFLLKMLLFENNEEDFVSFVQTSGFPDFDLESLDFRDRLRNEDWTGKFGNWRQTQRLSFLDEQVGKRPRSLYMKEGLITEKTPEQIKAMREQEIRRQKEDEKMLAEKKRMALEAARLEHERKEVERQRRIKEEIERKEREDKERKDRQAEEQKLKEERLRREKEERERMEKEKEKEMQKQRIIKKFKDLFPHKIQNKIQIAQIN